MKMNKNLNDFKPSNYNLRFDSPGPSKKLRHISELDIKQNDESEHRDFPIKNQISTKANAITKTSKTMFNNYESSSNNLYNENNSTNKNIQNIKIIIKENKSTEKSHNSLSVKNNDYKKKPLSPESNQNTNNTDSCLKNKVDLEKEKFEKNKNEENSYNININNKLNSMHSNQINNNNEINLIKNDSNKSKKSLDINNKDKESENSKISKIENSILTNKETTSRKNTNKNRQLVHNENIRKDDSKLLNVSKKIRITNDSQSNYSKQNSVHSKLKKEVLLSENDNIKNMNLINNAITSVEEVKYNFTKTSSKKGSKIYDDDKSTKSEGVSSKIIYSKNNKN